MTPQNRYYADLSDPAIIHIITISRRPPDITCTPKHARYVGGIVITLQQFTKESTTRTEKIYIQERLKRVKIQLIHYKDPKHSESKIVSDYG